jgi:hypothetical protein
MGLEPFLAERIFKLIDIDDDGLVKINFIFIGLF